MKKYVISIVVLLILFLIVLYQVSKIPENTPGIFKDQMETEYTINVENQVFVYDVPEWLFDDPPIVMEVNIATPCQAIEEPKKKVDVFVNYASRYHLTMQSGVFDGPSGKETYYNLDMSRCISIMRNMGYGEEEYPVWTRFDGAKMFGDYVMCAAELGSRPKGTILKTSMGWAIVVDTGTFAYGNPSQIDICTTW